jgi:hypothetical protein
MNINDPHLTEEHAELLETIWNFPTWNDLAEWANTLSPRRHKMASTLVYLLNIELVDEMTAEITSEQCVDANNLISKFNRPLDNNSDL